MRLQIDFCRSFLFAAFLLVIVTIRMASAAQAQGFTYQYVFHDMPDVTVGAVSFADADLDGDYDVLLSGIPLEFSSTDPNTFSYLGVRAAADAKSVSLESRGLPVAGWSTGQAWSDYNNDGWLDVVISGIASRTLPYIARTALYQGSREGLQLVRADVLAHLHSGSASWVDYDCDGDDDLLLTGVGVDAQHKTILYRNKNDTLVSTKIMFPGIAYGDAGWGDYDGDGDPDLLLAGSLTDGTYFTGLFRNDGKGGFQRQHYNLPQLHFAHVAWGDYDADGDLDLALNGGRPGLYVYNATTMLYANVDGVLEATHVALPDTYWGEIAWGDYDIDGDLDLMITGASGHGKVAIAQVYANNGGFFEKRTILPGANGSSIAWGDTDADGDLDLMMNGTGMDGMYFTAFYRNTSEVVNKPPSPPTALNASVNENDVLLTWEASSDVLTPSAGLSYAVRVGTSEDGFDIVTSTSNSKTGRRALPKRGNAGHGTSYRLKNLAPGMYYWSVQAVDASFVGSPFAAVEASFTIDDPGKNTSNEAPNTYPFALEKPRPNPTPGPVDLAFSLPHPGDVQLIIYNVLGQRVAVLEDGFRRAGTHQVRWSARTANGMPISAGIYFCRLTTAYGQQMRPFTVIR